MISRKERMRFKDAKNSLKDMRDSRLTSDYTLLQYLIPETGSRLSLILPKRFHKTVFRNGVPLFGLKTGVRAMLTVMVAALFLLMPVSDVPDIPVVEHRTMEFTYIAPGTFTMGSDEGGSNEKPPHRVTFVNGFYMQKTEVTQGQWKALMGNNPSKFKQGDNYPVESVSWNDVQTFIEKLNQETGKNHRLPTEAEWEYAARAGTTTPFNTGENLTTDQANYDGNYPYKNNPKGKFVGKTTPVGTYPPNEWKLSDMHGNVWEWCNDWYEKEYYKNSPVNDPTGPDTGSGRVIRGGSWIISAGLCRSSYRYDFGPSFDYDFLGFRLVLPQAIR
ncbi:MAG: formylglycine-generating enzyme family protein [Planctomycetes bacterium]|nr:formylglycine-generating enzyme family protein [Planctomycetota bacterium]